MHLPPFPPSPFLFLLLLLPLTLATPQADTTVTLTTTLPPSTTTISSTFLAASQPTLSPQYTDETTFTHTLLNSTNYWRYLYSAPFLSFNASLASYAQAYSTRCVWKHNPDLSTSRLGENLAKGYNTVVSAVDAWGNESVLYDWGDVQGGAPTGNRGFTGWSEATGHFTQLVWKDTGSVGCGWTACNGKNGLEGVLLVCNYYPAGNVLGPDGEDKYQYFLANLSPERNGGATGYNATAGAEGVGGGEETASATATGATMTVSGGAERMRIVRVGQEEDGGKVVWALSVVVFAAFAMGMGMV